MPNGIALFVFENVCATTLLLTHELGVDNYAFTHSFRCALYHARFL